MKFFHIRDPRKAGVITIAAEVVDNNIYCGVSYCCPIERNFSRPLGRKIAEGRLKLIMDSHRFLEEKKGFIFEGNSIKKMAILEELETILYNCGKDNWVYILVNTILNDLYTQIESKPENTELVSLREQIPDKLTYSENYYPDYPY